MAYKKRKISFDGKRLNEAIRIRKITKANLCKAIGFTYVNLKKCIQTNLMMKDDLIAFAKYLNVNYEYLLGGSTDSTKELYQKTLENVHNKSSLDHLFWTDSYGNMFTKFEFSFLLYEYEEPTEKLIQLLQQALKQKFYKYGVEFFLDESMQERILKDRFIIDCLYTDINSLIMKYIDYDNYLDSYIEKYAIEKGRIDFKLGIISDSNLYHEFYKESKKHSDSSFTFPSKELFIESDKKEIDEMRKKYNTLKTKTK